MYPPPPPPLPIPPMYQTPVTPTKKRGVSGKIVASILAVLLVLAVGIYAGYALTKSSPNTSHGTSPNLQSTPVGNQPTIAPTDTAVNSTPTVGQTGTATSSPTAAVSPTAQATQSATLPYKANFVTNSAQWSSGGFQVNASANTISCGSDNPYSATPGFVPATPDYTVVVKMQFLSDNGGVTIQGRSGKVIVSYDGNYIQVDSAYNGGNKINRTLPFTITVTFKGPNVIVAIDQAGFHYTYQSTTTNTSAGEASISTQNTAITVSDFEIKAA